MVLHGLGTIGKRREYIRRFKRSVLFVVFFGVFRVRLGYGNPHDHAGEVHGPSGPQTSSGPDPRIYPHQVYGDDVGASVAMVNAWNPVVRGDVRPSVEDHDVRLGVVSTV